MILHQKATMAFFLKKQNSVMGLLLSNSPSINLYFSFQRIEKREFSSHLQRQLLKKLLKGFDGIGVIEVK